MSRAATAVLVRNRNQKLLGKVVIVLNRTCDDVRLLEPAEWAELDKHVQTGLSWRLGVSQQSLTQSARSHGGSNRAHEGPMGAVARRERCGARTTDLSARDLSGD